ncbi:hypothetical protein A2961_00235 [Candidatus Woesebacteria bacterium RIFCSPLOWO2_01_FULL_39_21]|uniref:GDP-Man:Man(1)GlcNAc(2)-PP-Dol alpha-1,3-mannosyltransferase n=1 Tax=Candidatus Woesebacteria bacterium RIFCSPLOWO2_01_FULL_39_21 TaxID=1802519 RepID=A0A1F8BLT3_9BACT|nr:MAG: hypothetical protein A2691_02830 [Candidatus Woesebacteria bacterium RIFCSPHIGHO2_01_FULL_39_23]OGM64305.1 MAG: hypothetical protein A2961_00235 [Candidatus Woesebacteria bacterium RIFCSPLOWO2_01_FULL_39_21]
MRKGGLRIAIFHLAFIYSGGGEKLVLQEAEGLKGLGHEVEIFTSVVKRSNCFPDYIKKFQIKTFLPQINYIVENHESTLILLSCILAPFFSVRFRKYDVILAANQPSPWMAFWVKNFFGVPYVTYLAQPTRILHQRLIDKKTGLRFAKKTSGSLSTRLLGKFKPFIKWADEVSINNSNAVLSNGDYMKNLLEKIYKIDVVSCPAGVASPITGYRSLVTARDYFLLITNRHYGQKRFEYGIFTFSYVLHKNPNFELLITGEETEYTNSLKTLVNQLGLGNKVKFLGYVSEKELGALYRKASVYLYTAPEEDFGMGIIEAMANGAPVVAWNNAGPTGIIENGKTGLLAKPFDIADFSHQVERLISDKSLSSKVCRNAFNKVKSTFSLDNHIKLLDETLLKYAS